VARALLVGCGCRGRTLGTSLLERGWAVRGTSRTDAGLAPIEAAGIEPARADPLHPGTVFDLVGDVTVLAWLMGSAVGDVEGVEAIHGARLESLIEKLVDTPVRGFAYEARGSVSPDLLDRGGEILADATERWRIPVAMLDADPADPSWGEAAGDAIESLLSR
jgi:hypothetical protein